MATTYDKASLVMIPSGYKDDKLYSVKPTDGSGDFTFSRDGAGASPATRVNASGLIEKGRENLLLQSNQFDTTWSNNRSYETSGQADPDGGTNAWKFREDANTGTHILQQNLTPSAGVYTFSVTAKAAERSGVQVLVEAASSYGFANFDLTDGSVQNSGQLGSITFIDATSVDLGGGWYRLSVSVYSSISLAWTKFYLLDGSFSTSYTGIDGNGIFVYQSQLEQGLVATDYIETTTAPVSAGLLGDMPRLDYSGGATCPSLLLEPSRVNLVAQSEYFGSWVGSNRLSTPNEIASPEGISNGTKLAASGGTAYYAYQLYSTSGANVFSVFLKYGTQTIQSIYAYSSGSYFAQATFNLSTGVVDNVSNGTASIEDYGNGWYRCSVQGNAAASLIEVGIEAIGASDYTYAYGAQLESGSYPTSYIPTYGSAASRANDYVKVDNRSNIGQTEGTIFLEMSKVGFGTSAAIENSAIALFEISSSAQRYIVFRANGVVQFVEVLGTTQVSIISANGVYTDGDNVKIAAAYSQDDFVLYVNGTQVGSDTSGNVAACDRVVLGYTNDSVFIGQNKYKQALLFKTRLTNAELAALTA